MAFLFRTTGVFLFFLGLTFSAHAGTRERCYNQLSKDGYSVSLSSSYNGVTFVPLAACAVMTGGACLGAALADIASGVGLDLAILALKNLNSVVDHDGKQIQAGVCSKDYKIAGITFTDYYFYVRHRPASVIGPDPEPENLHEFVRSFYAGWGYLVEGGQLDHWVVHHLHVGRARWMEDALRNVIVWRYQDWGLPIADADLNFWYQHLLNAGRLVWDEHQRKSVIQTLFSKCGVDIGSSGPELEHWYRHSLNVSKVKFVLDLTNGRTCDF